LICKNVEITFRFFNKEGRIPMEVYKAGDKWILGVNGGEFAHLKREPEAVILSQRPEPVRMWCSPIERQENETKKRFGNIDVGSMNTSRVKKIFTFLR
jgi:hypothetical protein